MNTELNHVIESIGEEYRDEIGRGSRHYLEVSVGRRAAELGYGDLGRRYEKTYAVIPLKTPQKGMKVRIDGRTFVNYAEYESGVVVPGYLAREAGKPGAAFVPRDSMICNFA